MSCSITVGSLADDQSRSIVETFVWGALRTEDDAESKRSFLSRFLRKDTQKSKASNLVSGWYVEVEPVAMIDPLNLASLQLFTQHTAQLEGLVDDSGTGEGSIWPNLPYWMYSIWLPIDRPVQPLISEIDGMPTFFGTVAGLLSNLQEIQKLSKLKLGAYPKNFNLMLDDPNTFHAIHDLGLNERETIQWVWLSLMKGAELSMKNNKPLLFES
jgi:hypothetical protein